MAVMVPLAASSIAVIRLALLVKKVMDPMRRGIKKKKQKGARIK